MSSDAWGLDVTPSPTAAEPSDTAVERFDELVRAFWGFDADIGERMERAVAEPSLPLSRIAVGCFLFQAHTANDHERAAGIVRHIDPTGLTARERLHHEALSHLVAGQTDRAIDAWEQLLEQWPTDALALRLQHVLLFNRGRLTEMLASVERSRAAWEDRPFRSHLGGMACFALEELGRYREAEPEGRAAAEADPTDLWSIHAVAHVLEMEGRTEDGLAWFDGRGDVLHSKGAFARHLWWHHAIIHLRTGRHEQILELYDTEIQPGSARDGLSLTNAVDALARLEFAGVDVGDRWLALAEPAAFRLDHHDHPFNDCHYVFALARAGADRAVDELLSGMEAWTDRETTAARVIDTVGLDTARAMAALGRGDTSTAADLLRRTHDDRWQLGGSHAQRRVFDLAEATANAG